MLQHVCHYDYVGMCNEEIEKREQFFYPPFSRIIPLTFKHKGRDVAQEAAHQFANKLEVPYSKYLVGPAEPVVNRVRNLYLMELLVKLPRDAQLIAQCKADILKQSAILHGEKKFSKVIITPDVDAI